MSGRGFQVVDTPPAVDQEAQQRVRAQQAVATQGVLLALRALGQRTLVALSTMFTAAAIASAWVLWRSVLPDPSTTQLVGLGMYALFILAVESVRRRG